MSASAVPKNTQKVAHRVVVAGLADSPPDIPPDPHIRPGWRMMDDGMMRRGAATDLTEQVGDAIAVPRIASVAGEKSMWWSPEEKDVRTKKAGQSDQGCETGRTKV